MPPLSVLAVLLLLLPAAVHAAPALPGGGKDPAGQDPTPATAATTPAQTGQTDQADTIITSAALAQAREALNNDTTLSAAQKKTAGELYDHAAQWLQEYQQTESELSQLQTRVKQAPERIKALKARLAKPVPAPALPPADTALDQLQLLISQEQASLQQAQDTLTQAQATLSRLQIGAKGIGDQITKHTQLINQIESDLAAAPSGDPPLLARAHRLALQVRRQLHQAQLAKLKLELGNLDLLVNLSQAEQDLADAQVKAHQQRLELLQKGVQAIQASQAHQAVQQAEVLQAQSSTLPPALRAIAAANADYRKELQALIQKENTLGGQLQAVQGKTESLASSYSYTRQRVEMVGLTEAVARMLRRRRVELPPVNTYRRNAAERTRQMDQATERQIEIEDLQHHSPDPDTVVQQVLAQAPKGLAPKAREYLRQRTLKLAQARDQALDELQTEYGRYVGQLAQLNLAEQELISQAQAFADYIDQQLIWSPSPGLDSLFQARAWARAAAWATDPKAWAALHKHVLAGVHQRSGRLWADLLAEIHHRSGRLLVVLLLVVAVLAVTRRHARRQLREIAAKTRRIRSDSFLLTLHALWLTIAIATPVPLLLVGSSFVLEGLPGAPPLSLALAAGLLNLGIMLGVIGLIRSVCQKDGLAERHLRWPAPVREALVCELRWLLPVILPLGFVIGLAYPGNSPDAIQALGQLGFVLLMVVLVVALVRLLRRNSPITAYLLAKHPNGWLMQMRFAWYPLLLALPLALAAVALSGYYYTALQFAIHVRMTIWMFFLLLLVRDLLLRWFYIAERRLRMQDAIKRQAEQGGRSPADTAVGAEDAQPIQVEEQALDFSELSEQSRRLVRFAFLVGALAGAWSIWSEILPALSGLNNITLPFSTNRVIDGVPKEVPVTLGDLSSGLLLLLVTALGAKNLPGLMEMTLLRRLPLTPGTRYAITSLSQYIIVAVGIFWAFVSIGLQWSSIQWLVAALGVGVGFGLQEIVANFICGVILLFERPLRVGDVISVDGTTGTVARIHIRATTIITWDLQELLVPNKELITGRLLNWTLSNKSVRTVITVGVAYGSDVALAMKLLVEAAQENPNVLDDPAPAATFEEFADSALTLRLRAYVSSVDVRITTTSALHQAINDKFNRAGIVIAFPQQDVHLDTGGKPLQIQGGAPTP